MYIIKRIKNVLFKAFHKSVSIFVFHQVSDEFDAEIDCESDWTSTELFKKNVEWIEKNYTIISLDKALSLLNSGKRLRKKQAVLTFDDGYASVANAIEILEEKKIPATIFVNTAYIDDKKLSIVNVVNYISSKKQEELSHFSKELLDTLNEMNACKDNLQYMHGISVIEEYMHEITLSKQVYLSESFYDKLDTDLFTIGMHGHEHLDSTLLTHKDFEANVLQNRDLLKKYKNFRPYFSFPYGTANNETIEIVNQLGCVPFLCNGATCYSKSNAYNRIPIDGIDLSTL